MMRSLDSVSLQKGSHGIKEAAAGHQRNDDAGDKYGDGRVYHARHNFAVNTYQQRR